MPDSPTVGATVAVLFVGAAVLFAGAAVLFVGAAVLFGDGAGVGDEDGGVVGGSHASPSWSTALVSQWNWTWTVGARDRVSYYYN